MDATANETAAGARDNIFTVSKSTAPKCERCWRFVQDVGNDTRYPTVCLRCADALKAINYPPYPAPTDGTEPKA